jgi:hypothetical protein
MMYVEVVENFETARARFGQALSYSSQQNLFRSLEWFECLAQFGFRTIIVPRIYVARIANEPEEIAFLFCMTDPAHGMLTSLTNYYALEYSVIFAPGARRREELSRAVISYIAGERPRWNLVALRLLYEHDLAVGWLEDALRENDFASYRYFQFENYFVRTAARDFAGYYEGLPSRLRNTIRRREKKLRAERDVKILTVTSFSEALGQDYMRVYEKSWKKSEASPDFIFELCRTAETLGSLRLGLMYVDGVPAAAQLWLISGPRAIIYKLAYDEAYESYSVGSILTRELASFVLSHDHPAELDYGVGSEPYKKDWMDERRCLIGIEANNHRTVTGAMHAAEQRVRSGLKRMLART